MNTQEDIRKTARTLMEENQNTLIDLYNRWQDEQEYEDFSDYVDVMRDSVASGSIPCTFVRGTKRPFGFTVKMGKLTYRVSTTWNRMTCKMEVSK